MPKLKLLIPKEVDQEHLNTFRSWAKVNESIKKFHCNANIRIFNFLFGDDGERLWIHFVKSCDHDFTKFMTYLKQEQINILLVNIYLNDLMYSL